MATTQAAGICRTAARQGIKEMHGVVVSAGLMDKTVKVRMGGLRWEPRVQKYFKQPKHFLVHDPRNSVRQGDIVSITPSWRVAQHVRHTVKHIISPHGGEAIEDRPPVPTLEERIAEREAKRAAKDARRNALKEEQNRMAAEARAENEAIRKRKMAALAAFEAKRTKPAASASPGERARSEDVD